MINTIKKNKKQVNKNKSKIKSNKKYKKINKTHKTHKTHIKRKTNLINTKKNTPNMMATA